MAISILGAYVRRLRTGQGEHLQVAMQDSVMHYIRNAFTYTERTGGKAAPRAGSKTVGGGNPPIGVYPCKGGGPNDYVYIFTSRANPEHWTRLLKVLGREDLIGDARYATPRRGRNGERKSTRSSANGPAGTTSTRPCACVSHATIPAAAVLDTAELAADQTFQERGIRQTMKHPTAGEYVMSGWPVRFGGADACRGGGAAARPARRAKCWPSGCQMGKDQIDGLRKEAVVG